MEAYHEPVLLTEALDLLEIEEDEIVVDCTIGEGGHSIEFAKRIGKEGFLIGIDLDEFALDRAQKRLADVGVAFKLFHGNFKDIGTFLRSIDINYVDKIFLDLGMSSFQLSRAERGFSFKVDGPLDMRMDRDSALTAAMVLNTFKEEEISWILWIFGEERFSKRIAREIVKRRKLKPIETTHELANIVLSVYPASRSRIHPATKTFQALRIFVNSEIDNLKTFLEVSPAILKIGGRIAIISYHSLEDKIVKNAFKNSKMLKIISKKVVTPSRSEISINKRARSARMRIAERI